MKGGARARGGRPCAKKWEGARHRGPKGRARRCDQIERAHEKAERRLAKARINEQLQDVE